MIRLSIIIPFYNVEQYIAQCLDSVYRQDIPEEEYEVICVDDCSQDGSLEIVKQYQKKHVNLILLKHEVNKKLGAARNTGFNTAKGNYIWHVDSDDKIESNCLQSLLNICEKKQLDVLEFGFIDWYPDRVISCRDWEPTRRTNIMTGQEYINAHFLPRFGLICPIWRRVYRNEFLKMNSIVSPPINMGEDEPFAIHVFTTAQRVAFELQDWYYHRIRRTSLVGETKKLWSAKKWCEVTIDCPYYMHLVYKQVKSCISPSIKKAIVDMITYNVLFFDSFSSDFNEQAKKEYWSFCRRNLIRNRFLFQYLSRKKRFTYFWNILCN